MSVPAPSLMAFQCRFGLGPSRGFYGALPKIGMEATKTKSYLASYVVSSARRRQLGLAAWQACVEQAHVGRAYCVGVPARSLLAVVYWSIGEFLLL